MLKILVSKNDSSIYREIVKQKKLLKFVSKTQDVEMSQAISLSQSVSIFGDQEVYLIKNLAKDDLVFLNTIFFKNTSNSEHLFFLVGTGVDFEKICNENNQTIIKIEEKVTYDFPADLVSALQKHDRKNSWSFIVRELKNKDAEPVHGTCVFAYKSLLTYLVNPLKNSPQSSVKDFSWQQAGQNAKVGKREKKEVGDKYFDLVLKYHLARSGQGDLATQLERWALQN